MLMKEEIESKVCIGKDMNKRKYYLLYTFIFIIMILVVFCLFIFNNKSFVWESDGLNQHYRALLYYSQWLKSIVKTLLVDHQLVIPTYSFSIVYGSYAIGDPLNILAIFIPIKYMIYFYSILILVRFYLSGLTFSLFCYYKKDKYNYNSISMLIGSFVYAFCGYALYAGIRHPYFMNPMIYFPLVLLGEEKILNKRSTLLFILSVWLSAISNFYFFYMIAILTAMYVIWRLLTIYKKNYKNGLFMLGKITFYAFLGTCMAFVLLLPAILGLMNSARTDVSYIYNMFYTLSSYKSMLVYFYQLELVMIGHVWDMVLLH